MSRCVFFIVFIIFISVLTCLYLFYSVLWASWSCGLMTLFLENSQPFFTRCQILFLPHSPLYPLLPSRTPVTCIWCHWSYPRALRLLSVFSTASFSPFLLQFGWFLVTYLHRFLPWLCRVFLWAHQRKF